MWEFPIVILQITIRQDFLISCDTYTSTHKRICQLQVTSRVKGTWRRGNGNIVIGHIVWRGHHGTWSNRKRGTVFLFLFFTTTFTTKLGKNKKKKKKLLAVSKIWFWCYVLQNVGYTFILIKKEKLLYGHTVYLPPVMQLILVCDGFYLL